MLETIFLFKHHVNQKNMSVGSFDLQAAHLTPSSVHFCVGKEWVQGKS